MIRFERVLLPTGMNAFARRENGTVVVYVSSGLSAAARRAAIRHALRAAAEAGWRPAHSPVRLPALIGGAGLRWAPAGRWANRALMTAATAGAGIILAVTALGVSAAPHHAAGPPATLQPGPQPTAGPAHSATGARRSRGTGTAPGSSAAHSGSPGQQAKAKAEAKAKAKAAGAPAPEASGQPSPVTTGTSDPQPSSAPTPNPEPSPSPSLSPTKGTCLYVLGVLVCVPT